MSDTPLLFYCCDIEHISGLNINHVSIVNGLFFYYLAHGTGAHSGIRTSLESFGLIELGSWPAS
jgi:hypothetical protein